MSARTNVTAESIAIGMILRGELKPSEHGLSDCHFSHFKTLFGAVCRFAGSGGGTSTDFVMHLATSGELDRCGGAAIITAAEKDAQSAMNPPALVVQALRKAHGERLIQSALHALTQNPSDPEALERIAEGRRELECVTTTPKNQFDFVHCDDIEAGEGAFDFVENLLTEGASSVVYGASNSGKTFFVLDLAAHVATGREWMESEVERGAVVYVALEGHHGARNRIRALQLTGRLTKESPFFLCFSAVNLLDPDHPAAITRLIENVQSVSFVPVRLVIIDTLARAMAGGDENSGADMGQAVATIDAVRAKTGAHVMLIHHCGKDAARGARGHSSLRAAIDTEIEVIHPEGDKYRTATIVKQRDIAPRQPICFSLEAVEVGTNRRGKPITSCVVKEEDSIMAHTKGRPGARAKYSSEMLLELLPQPSIKAWRDAAKLEHGMGQDAFETHKSRCASSWKKTKQGGIMKADEPLIDKENRGNRGN